MRPDQQSDAGFEVVRQAARALAPDLYTSALLVPRPVRAGLIVLAAAAGDIGRIPLAVEDATLALIRLQWWRDALEGRAPGEASGHPVADALAGLLRNSHAMQAGLGRYLEATETLLEAWEEKGEDALWDCLDASGGALFHMAGVLTSGAVEGEGTQFLGSAGRAYAALRLALDLPRHVAQGRLPVPATFLGTSAPSWTEEGEVRAAVAAAQARLSELARSELLRARGLGGKVGRPVLAAALPAALIEPYLRALQKPGRDVLREPADIAPLRRAAGLWLASVRARI